MSCCHRPRRLPQVRRGHAALQSVTILAVAAMVLVGFVTIGRIVTDRSRERLVALFDSSPSALPATASSTPATSGWTGDSQFAALEPGVTGFGLGDDPDSSPANGHSEDGTDAGPRDPGNRGRRPQEDDRNRPADPNERDEDSDVANPDKRDRRGREDDDARDEDDEGTRDRSRDGDTGPAGRLPARKSLDQDVAEAGEQLDGGGSGGGTNGGARNGTGGGSGGSGGGPITDGSGFGNSGGGGSMFPGGGMGGMGLPGGFGAGAGLNSSWPPGGATVAGFDESQTDPRERNRRPGDEVIRPGTEFAQFEQLLEELRDRQQSSEADSEAGETPASDSRRESAEDRTREATDDTAGRGELLRPTRQEPTPGDPVKTERPIVPRYFADQAATVLARLAEPDTVPTAPLDQIHILGFDCTDPTHPRLKINVFATYEEIQVVEDGQLRAFAPPADIYCTIPVSPASTAEDAELVVYAVRHGVRQRVRMAEDSVAAPESSQDSERDTDSGANSEPPEFDFNSLLSGPFPEL